MLEIVSALAVLMGLLVVAFSWKALPPTIPTHFGSDGQIDAWGSKNTLFIIPAVSFVLYVMLSLVTWVIRRRPEIGNYPVAITEDNAEAQYRIAIGITRWIKLEMMLMTSYLTWNVVRMVQGKGQLSIFFIPLLIAVLAATIVFFVTKALHAK